MGSNKHLTKFDEIAVSFVVYLDDTPWIGTTSDLAAIRRPDETVGAYNCKGKFALDAH